VNFGGDNPKVWIWTVYLSGLPRCSCCGQSGDECGSRLGGVEREDKGGLAAMRYAW
jgi:hypothetical protein